MPLTPDSDLDLLFPEELVPLHIKSELPPELHVRPPIHISAISSFPSPMSYHLFISSSLTYSMLLYLH
jgi:hypothetical protein